MPRGNDMDRMVRDLKTADRRIMGGAARAVMGAAEEVVDRGYRDRRDIYGKTYIPAKDGHLPQMERTGRLRRAYQFIINELGAVTKIVISELTEYGDKLRDGTDKMKPRKHIPSPGEAPPPRWDVQFHKAIEGAVKRAERAA